MQFVRATGAAALFLFFGTVVPAYAQHEQQSEKQGKPEQQQGRPQQAAPRPAEQQRPQAQPQPPKARAQQPQQRAQPAPQRQPQQQQAQRGQQQKQPQAQQHAQPAQQPQQRAQQTPQQQQGQRPQQARQQQQPQRTHQQAVAWQQKRGWVQKGGWQEHSTWQQGRTQHWDTDHRTWAQRGGYGGYYIPQATFNLSFGSQHWFRMHSRPTMYMGYPRFSYGGFSFMLVDPWPESWAENWYATDDVYIGYDDGYYLYNRRYPGVGLAVTVAL